MFKPNIHTRTHTQTHAYTVIKKQSKPAVKSTAGATQLSRWLVQCKSTVFPCISCVIRHKLQLSLNAVLKISANSFNYT